jgi:hypothetical protein
MWIVSNGKGECYELVCMWKELVIVCVKDPFQYLPAGTQENHENPCFG